MLDLSSLRAAVRSEGGISRRLFLAYGTALAALPVVGERVFGQVKQQPKFTADPFSLGVASGDPTDTGVVLWTGLAQKPLEESGGMPSENVEVQQELAGDEGMKTTLKSGYDGRDPTTRPLGSHRSGRTETGPLVLLPLPLWRRDQSRCPHPHDARTVEHPGETAVRVSRRARTTSKGFTRLTNTWRRMNSTWCSTSAITFMNTRTTRTPGPSRFARTPDRRPERSSRWKITATATHSIAPTNCFQKAHHRCPWVVTWDDHEFDNNYANDISEKNADPKKAVDPAVFLEQRASAYQAYYEMMPLREAVRTPRPGHETLSHDPFRAARGFQVLDTGNTAPTNRTATAWKELN